VDLKKTIRALKRELDAMTAVQAFIAYAFLLVFLVAPLVLMVGQAFIYQGGTSFRWFTDLLSSPEYVSFTSRGGRLFEVRRGVMYLWGFDYGILLNSLIVAFFVTVFCSIIGVVAAMLMGRYRFPGKGIFRVLLLIPLLATPFVNAYIIGKLFNPRGGLINYLLVDLLHILPWRLDIDGLVGVIFAQTLSYYPIIFLNVLASLNSIDPSVEEMAENLGARGLRLFRTVTAPLFLPGLAAGAIIVFIFSLEDLGAPIGFAGARANPLSRKLISYQVYSSFAEALTGSFSPKIAALAVIILFIAVAGFLIIRRYVNMRTYAMLSKGGRWSPRLRTPSIKTRVAIILSLLFLVTLASMPQIGTVILATSNWALSGTLPTKATGQYLGTLISDPDVSSIGNVPGLDPRSTAGPCPPHDPSLFDTPNAVHDEVGGGGPYAGRQKPRGVLDEPRGQQTNYILQSRAPPHHWPHSRGRHSEFRLFNV
jgi:ABC-type Fe3+ transport system permease subunit